MDEKDSLKDLKDQLREAVVAAQEAKKAQQEPFKSDEQVFEEIYSALKNKMSLNSTSSASSVPPLVPKLPAEDDLLGQKLHEEARAALLQRRSQALLDNDELKRLWTLLDTHAEPADASNAAAALSASFSSSVGESEQVLNYHQFKAVAAAAGEKCQPYFKASVFAKLQHGDPHGRISVMVRDKVKSDVNIRLIRLLL